MNDQKEFLVYLDGKMVPESQAKVSIFDRGFHGGDSVHEAIRSFNGELYKLPEHTARLFRSLKAARIDPQMSPEQMNRISQEVLEANERFRADDEDFWVYQPGRPYDLLDHNAFALLELIGPRSGGYEDGAGYLSLELLKP